jgi:hypothetical protein
MHSSSPEFLNVLTAVALAAFLVSAPSHAEPEVEITAKGCAAKFDTAQRMDMESFRDYDARTFRAVHHPDAVTIFASAHVFYGIDDIMAALASHFENREAVWTWTELYRVVDGCKSAYILYDATYDIPSVGFHQRTLTGVTYTYQRGRWLAVADQNTYLDAPTQ